MSLTKKSSGISWQFSDQNDGSFFVEDANHLPVLYFPLMNSKGMKSFVTPVLKGDVCKDFNHYLTTPTVTEEIHRTLSSRNFWLKVDDLKPWSATGQSVFQKASHWNGAIDGYSVAAKIGSFTTKRKQELSGVEVEITTVVPEGDDFVELLKIRVLNTSTQSRKINPYYALPLYGRSADNFRDHRQVTTMFQENYIEDFGVRIKPRIKHDESCHSINHTNYAVLAFDENGTKPEKIWARLKDFIGQSGTLDNPEAIYKDLTPPKLTDSELHGTEAIAAVKFKEKNLLPGESVEYVVIHGITDSLDDISRWSSEYANIDHVNQKIDFTLNYWKEKLNSVNVSTGNHNFDNWVKWIEYQVKCRQIFGNSYLPDYGYGRGGRGWRDLWQDLLSIFLVDPISAKEEIINCFKGIRVDGSNATIIGEQSGEFKADRNNIPRTWSDHGAWPVFVLNFYVNQSGDFNTLFKEVPYWKDQFKNRCKKIDERWTDSYGYQQKDRDGNVYSASIFEHVLIQQLTSFYNVNDKNVLLLEGADWNDTYDMARDRGGSVCFYSFYAHNFILLIDFLNQLKANGNTTIPLLTELIQLLDHIPGSTKVNYQDPAAKRIVLENYFKSVEHSVIGRKEDVVIDELIRDLKVKSEHISSHILENEILTTKKGLRFFNGHYDNLENKIGGEKNGSIMMDLTSQVIPIISNVSNKKMSAEVYEAIKKVLKDEGSPGIRLTSEFKEIDMNVGRITGFVYGHKEHGSKWVQQNIMLAYGLYKQGLVTQGNEIMQEVYEIANNTEKAQIFPGIPSYFNHQNKGAYAYLTGSSSWFLMTLITEIYGVKGEMGMLKLEPKLSSNYFDENNQSVISTIFSTYKIKVVYQNLNKLSYDDYRITALKVNDVNVDIVSKEKSLIINNFNLFSKYHINEIYVELN